MIWDAKIAQGMVQQRLRQLGLQKVAVFAIGCVTHSRDAVFAMRPSPVHPSFAAMSQLLDDFWRDYPTVLDNNYFADAYTKAKALLPNEVQRVDYSLAEDVLMDGIVCALSLTVADDYSDEVELRAMTAIDRAYVFVYTFHQEQDRIHQTEEEIEAAEANCGPCLDEIEFQLSLLSRLELVDGLPSSYNVILDAVNR